MAGAGEVGGMNINLHIDRLVLDGLPLLPRDRLRLQAALEAELIHLLTVNGLTADIDRSVARVAGAPIQITQDANMTVVGQEIARSVYAGIGIDDSMRPPVGTSSQPGPYNDQATKGPALL